jgi:hypothetical protein
MTTKTLTTVLCAAALAYAGAAQARLHDRGGGLIFDDVLNVTWLQDANLAQTSGLSADGRLNFQQATDWAADLVFVDSARGTSWSDWRLPSVKPQNGSSWDLEQTFNATSDWTYSSGSPQHELSHLFHVSLGNISGYWLDGRARSGVSGTDFGVVDSGPFLNLVNNIYWYGTDSPFNPGTHAATFLTFSGANLGNATRDSLFYAIAVRDGDVGIAAAVPEPGSWAILLAGLCLMGLRMRARQSRSQP